MESVFLPISPDDAHTNQSLSTSIQGDLGDGERAWKFTEPSST